MRIGLYPGTFDPVTNGHLDIFRRACSLVDRLGNAVAINRDKKPLFTLDERVAMIEDTCGKIAHEKNVEIIVHPFENLLVQSAKDVGASLIIRGLRSSIDFEYEYQMVGMNRAMNDEIETVFLPADAQYQSISSSLVKEITRLNGDISKFVPNDVATALKAKYAE